MLFLLQSELLEVNSEQTHTDRQTDRESERATDTDVEKGLREREREQ